MKRGLSEAIFYKSIILVKTEQQIDLENSPDGLPGDKISDK
jgi:hypothetical protein